MAETWVDQGGYLSNTELSKKFYYSAQPLYKFRQFTDVKSALGKHKGQSENWLRVADLGTVGGSLTETSTMIESSQAKTWGTISVDEYGNSIPFTFKVTALSKFDVEQIVKKGLRDDMVKCLDGSVERKFNETLLRYVGTATGGYVLTTNGTATASNTSVLNTYHIRKMVLELKKRNVPGYGSLNGDYVCVASHEAMENMFAALQDINQYVESGHKKILNGEVGRYFGVRFVEDGYASRFTYSASGRTSTAKSWGQNQSLDAYLFGAETVKEAVSCPEEIRAKEVTDYGRSHGIAWYFLGGWAIMWDTAANSRIIKWDSAG
ncbi:MAG: major capsid protein [Planctomycetota bacterium]|jgi:N4-gp56 family major capsid protein